MLVRHITISTVSTTVFIFIVIERLIDSPIYQFTPQILLTMEYYCLHVSHERKTYDTQKRLNIQLSGTFIRM